MLPVPQEEYNLSQQEGWLIPTALLELSMRSVNDLSEETVMALVEPDDASMGDLDGELGLLLDMDMDLRLIPLSPVKDIEATVIGVDASCIKLGETSSGLVIALRGAIAWRCGGRCRYLRIGPLVFHVTDQNRSEIYNALRSFCLGSPGRRGAPGLQYIPIRMARIFEHWMREIACGLFSNAIVLLDGSLAVGPGEAIAPLKALLKLARSNSSIVIAISKNSKLRFVEKRQIDVLNDLSGPYLLELGDASAVSAFCIKLLGRTYLAKLSPLGCTFRLDVDAHIPKEAGIEAVRALVVNDAIHRGYPEVLRLAHIMCTFTAPEVVAMQLMLSRAYGLKVIRRPNIRKLLFGPFGSGGG